MWRGRLNTPLVTPENNPPGTVARRVLIPADEGFLQLVTGALAELLEPDNYTETPGGLTIEETTQRFHAMFSTYLEPGENTLSTIPVGTILPHMITSALPDGWLPCDGAEYDTADYPALYAVLPAALQNGLTFNVPDLRLRAPFGQAGGGDGHGVYLGQGGGEATHLLTVTEMPQHAHGTPSHSHAVPAQTVPQAAGSVLTRGNLASWVGGTGSIPLHNNASPANNYAVTLPDVEIPAQSTTAVTFATANQGGNGAHNNMPPFLICNYAIVATAV